MKKCRKCQSPVDEKTTVNAEWKLRDFIPDAEIYYLEGLCPKCHAVIDFDIMFGADAYVTVGFVEIFSPPQGKVKDQNT
jgi:hypothetical protein